MAEEKSENATKFKGFLKETINEVLDERDKKDKNRTEGNAGDKKNPSWLDAFFGKE